MWNAQDSRGKWAAQLPVKTNLQIVSDVNKACQSEEFIISIGVVEAPCLLNTLNIHDRDKLRQRRNSSIQSERLENNRESKLTISIKDMPERQSAGEWGEKQGVLGVNTVIAVRRDL